MAEMLGSRPRRGWLMEERGFGGVEEFGLVELDKVGLKIDRGGESLLQNAGWG